MNIKYVLAIFVIVAAIGMASTVAIGSLTEHQALASKSQANTHISPQGRTNLSPTGASHTGVETCAEFPVPCN